MFIVKDNMRNAKSYDGNTYKFGVTINGADYIVKLPKDNDDSVITEYVASNFIRNIGISCHKTMLANYKGVIFQNGVSFNYDGIVVLLKDFTNENVTLHSFKDIGQSSVDTDLGDKYYTYDDVVHILSEDNRIDESDLNVVLRQFWRMYICDAILANRDRHWGNWGLLQDNVTKRCIVAPLYDNGAYLFPSVRSRLTEFYSNPKQFLYDRTYRFPASLLMLYDKVENRNKRTNYGEILGDRRRFKLLAEECNKLIKNVGFKGVSKAIVNAVNGVPRELAIFYMYIVSMRYLCLIERLPYDKAYGIVRGYYK